MTELRHDLITPIDGDMEGKNLLSIGQFSPDDITWVIREAATAEYFIGRPDKPGVNLLPFRHMKAVMRQPSTRTGGSMTYAMTKLGGGSDLISGSEGSSEAKDESLWDSWVAYATQADIIGTRTAESYGPLLAATAITEAYENGKLSRRVPVINLGDGQNEHPTQTLGDLYTIQKKLGRLDGVRLAVVGDQERYRAFHSLIIGAFTMGMEINAVGVDGARVPEKIVQLCGPRLIQSDDLDAAMRDADVLYMGRKPKEYNQDSQHELQRMRNLDEAYASWIVDNKRLQIMPQGSIVLHPRPRVKELDPSIDKDPRAQDVPQMESMIPVRMVLIANMLGKSLSSAP